MSAWIDVARADELPPGSWRSVEVADTPIVVFNVGGTYYALEDVCTHDGGILSGGTLEGTEVQCPRHGARFSIVTGEALTPPAYEPVATFAVRVENGTVQVNDERR
ncbi:MAG TPA: non-heme iron oxygenase ferredoxin subunit [Casimicrobiaceae bacterium]